MSGKEQVAEAMQLISELSQEDVRSALTAIRGYLNAPTPLLSTDGIDNDASGFLQDLRHPEPTSYLESFLAEPHTGPGKFPTMKYVDHYKTLPDGSLVGLGVWEYGDNAFKPRLPSNSIAKIVAEHHLKQLFPREHAKKMTTINWVKFLKDQDKLIGAVKNLGTKIPKDGAGLSNLNAEAVTKVAATRYAIKTAVAKQAAIGGVWQNALLTGVFDIKLLIDGEFQNYFLNVGKSGVSGGTIGGLAMWIEHPFFGNNAVLGVLVGSVFNTGRLVSTGDWARFGKSFGINSIAGASAWGASAGSGALVGAMGGGPIGAAVGSLVGGIAGAVVGRKLAIQIPGIGGLTQYEVEKMATSIKAQLAKAGVQPDQSKDSKELVSGLLEKGADANNGLKFGLQLSTSQVAAVGELHDVLAEMQKNTPDAFAVFLDGLREMRSRGGVGRVG